MAEQAAKRVRITGRVQGVGYRAFSQEMARSLGVTGWVKNEEDGSVSALIAGDREAVDRMLTAFRDGPAAARVEDVEAQDADPDPWPDRFAYEP